MQFLVSCVSAIIFAILSVGIILYTLILMVKAPSERTAMEQLKDDSDSVEIDVSETE
jgi:hypothetical protein